MEALKEKYQKNLQELEHNVPLLEKIVTKPFDKDEELAQLKKDVSRLEKEITIKIQKNQALQQNHVEVNGHEVKEAPVIKMDAKEQKIEKSLLPKKVVADGKVKGVRI